MPALGPSFPSRWPEVNPPTGEVLRRFWKQEGAWGCAPPASLTPGGGKPLSSGRGEKRPARGRGCSAWPPSASRGLFPGSAGVQAAAGSDGGAGLRRMHPVTPAARIDAPLLLDAGSSGVWAAAAPPAPG